MTQTRNYNSPLLLEIGTEDLPARFLPPAIQQLKENSEMIFKENHIRFSDIKTYGTPRRLAMIADGIPLMQEDRTKEVFGPSKKVAFDEKGNPTRAATGFANSQGVSVEGLIIKNKDRGEYVVAVIEEKGVYVRELLPEILKKIVFSIYLPKSMRWGNSNIRFIRPIRWLLALFDKEVISFETDEIKSSNITRGHRFLSPAAFQIKEIPSYKNLLRNNYVVIDQEDRKRIITSKVEELSVSAEGKPVEDEELLETVVNLVEYPVPVIGTFPLKYLKLPRELLITVMKDHQKYFAVENGEGKLTNHFIVISNTSEDNSETVRVGAERVIKARFEDARFYFEEDSKKPLSERIEELKKVTFQERLGSLYEKAERMATFAGFLADKLLPSAKDKLNRAAWLAKTDLITGVVREFPELQGIIGKYYAIHDGEDSEVAEAMEEQYLPAHSGGKIPDTDIGALLSIADKIDNIASFFSIGITPTGSEDPFALRRQALGIIAILLKGNYNLNLKELVEKSIVNLKDLKDIGELKKQILQFIENRLQTVLSDQGYSPDLIQSIISLSIDLQLRDLQERLKALQKFKGDSEYNDFLTAIKRVHNIIPKGKIHELNTELLIEEPEKRLKERLDSVRSDLAGVLKEKCYDAIKLLSSLTEPINNFFDHVLVMDKREEIKQNRLALLNESWNTVSAIADFSKLSAG
ncbi:MAG: glycine--tRNA ligase subunit beta [Nitrospirae bacterium RBG_13_41_22]|nr:MAG: glycine--tRNA ligase subunit beta [Nitrospirae bacterium RBG_13_41_22]